MKHWPAHIQMRLTEEICIGRKSAVVRTLADRGERECPKGLEPGHFGAEIDERKVKHWKRMQTRYSSHKVILCLLPVPPLHPRDLLSFVTDRWV